MFDFYLSPNNFIGAIVATRVAGAAYAVLQPSKV